MLAEFSLVITKASLDPKTGEMRWAAVCSDTDRDSYGQYMSLGLFKDFIRRAEGTELPPVQFQSSYWQGGMPYLSLSHYPDKDGKLSLGPTTSLYIDGNRLKAKGTFHNTPLGRAAFEAVRKSLHQNPEASEDTEKKIRISIGFLDYEHTHGDFHFVRESLEQKCPVCEAGKREGMVFLSGHLIHLALTRIPVNKRTDIVEESMADITSKEEDAVSIVGEEVFQSEVAPELVQQSEVSETPALVIKSEEPVVDTVSTSDPVAESLSAIQATLNSLVERMNKPECEEEDDEDDMQMKACKKKNGAMYKSMASFSQALSSVVERGGNVEEMLSAIQEPFNQLGETVRSYVLSQVPTQPEPVQQSAGVDATVLKSLIQEAVSPLVQKITTLEAQVASAKVVTATNQAPQPRALKLQSTLVTNSDPVVTPKKAGYSPQEIAERSVYGAKY